jgi:hypothetical protein
LLGDTTDEERTALEREYFHSEDAVDRIEEVEDDLIVEYLTNRLTLEERRLFESEYLSAPRHRRRLETVRQLLAAASRAETERTEKEIARSPLGRAAWNVRLQWLGLAAALILVVAGAVWVFAPSRGQQEGAREIRPADVSPPEPSAPGVPIRPPASDPGPRVFAASIPPVSVRGGVETPSVIVPAGTDIVRLDLEGEPDGRTLAGGRASIRTVAGDEIWDGPAVVEGSLSPGVIARVDVLAARLPADDYVLTLFGTDGPGVEHEWSRYFLRVRAR